MIETIKYKGVEYPSFQAFGHASQFAIPYAKHVCVGKGYDIGCMKKEWAFPGATPIDLDFDDPYHAMNLPEGGVDYIFSSHCLEHLDSWVDAMDYWYDNLRKGGVLFLYLPDFSQIYWRPWNNRKHKHVMNKDHIYNYMLEKGYTNIFRSEIDLNNSFMIMGEKE